jgi:YesN/AraC family two-component response regulator
MKAPYFEKESKKVFTTVKNEPYNYPSHFHGYIEIAHCFSGEQKVVINGVSYTLYKGDTAIILPHVLHEYMVGDSVSGSSISIMSETSVLERLFPEISTCNLNFPIIKAGEFSTDTERLFLEISKTQNQTEILGYLTVILSKALNYLTFSPSKSVDNADIIKSLCNYIELNFSENLTIESLSKTFGYSKSYIAHVFSDKLKIPFRMYLNGLRCEKAYILLKLKSKSVTEVASEVGFLSLNTFTRTFKKLYGLSPSNIKNSR